MATSKLTASLHTAESAETSSGESEPIDLKRRSLADLVLSVVAVTGVVSLALQSSPDENVWRTEPSIGALAVGQKSIQLVKLQRYVKLAWTVGVGASATFSLGGSFHNVYAYISDMDASTVPKKAVGGGSELTHFLTIQQASDMVDAELCGSAVPPILDWGASITLRACQVLAHLMASKKGYNPEGPDAIILENYKDAMKWLGKASSGRRKSPDLVDSTPEKFEGAGLVISGTRREVEF